MTGACTERVSKGLWWTCSRDQGVLSTGDSAPERPLLSFTPGSGHVRADLLLLSGTSSIDLSTRPGALRRLLTDEAGRCGATADSWMTALSAHLLRCAPRWNVWRPETGSAGGLVGTLGGMTHPVLGMAYDSGTRPVEEIPLWASPGLMQKSLRDAARVTFGASKATRPVMRTFAVCLAPLCHKKGDLGRPAAGARWWSLGVAVAAAGLLEADQIAATLAAGAEADPPTEHEMLPSNDDMSLMKLALRSLGPAAAARVAIDAASAPSALHALRVLDLYVRTREDLEGAPPSRLERLESACLAVARFDTGRRDTPRRSIPSAPLRQFRTPSIRTGVTDREPALTTPQPPPPGRARPERRTFSYDAEITRLHGRRIGPLTLSLPWNSLELRAWGSALSNCLGSYASPVSARRTVVIGVREGPRLIGACEIRPEQTRLVQFLGRANRPLPDRVTSPVLRHLRSLALIA